MVKYLFFVLAGLLCVLYGTVILSVHSGTRFFAVWFLLGAFFLLAAVLGVFRIWDRLPRPAVRAGAAVLIAGAVLLAGTAGVVLIGGRGAERAGSCDCLIVLGAQVWPSGPSTVLRFRLDKAASYLREHPDTVCIVSGGQGYNEPCTEAEGMENYLAGKGISRDRILREPNASSTMENLTLSAALCDPLTDRVGIVTNQFHIFRSVLLAKKAGYAHAVGIPARSTPMYLPNNVLRECLAVWKDLLCGNLV